MQRECGDGTPPLSVQHLVGVGEALAVDACDVVAEVGECAGDRHEQYPYGLRAYGERHGRVVFAGRVLAAVQLYLVQRPLFVLGIDEDFERSFFGAVKAVHDSLRQEYEAVVTGLPVGAERDADQLLDRFFC